MSTATFFNLCIFLSLFIITNVYGQSKNTPSGFLDFNVYPELTDVDTDSVFTLNTAAKLPNRFSYFSLLNLYNQSSDNTLKETTSYYTEQNLRWQISDDSPLDLTLQMNFRTGSDNDRHRLGFRWRLNNTSYLESAFKAMNLKYSLNFHVVQFDKEDADVWQIEHVFMMKFPYISERLYLSGFADHTFNQDLSEQLPSSPIVGEVQMGFRLYENLFFVSEYRLNQYRRSDVNNLAIGLQYKMIW
jgi:hypothetical protein